MRGIEGIAGPFQIYLSSPNYWKRLSSSFFVVSISPIRKIFSGSVRWFDVVNDFYTVLCSTSVSAWPAAVYYIAYTADLADIAEMRKCKNSDYFIVRSKAISYTALSLI